MIASFPQVKSIIAAALSIAALPLSGLAEADSSYHGVFRELPPTAIKPLGWLAEILHRQKDGLALNRNASGFPFNTDLWAGKIDRAGWPSYEQTAYFVDGSYRCGLLINDSALTEQGLKNIRYVLEHPQPDGKLGPGTSDMKLVVGPDGVAGPQKMGAAWPFAVFTRALMAYYEETGDKRVLDALSKNYLSLSEKFGVDNRDVDTIEGMCWLAIMTGDNRFAQIAEQTWVNFENSPYNTSSKKKIWSLDEMTKASSLRGHGVSVSEISKQPILLYLATGKKEYLAAGLGTFRTLKRDHELVDGVLSSDAVLSGKQPDHQHETCVVPDYTWSLGYALMASGNAHFGDTIERAIYNAGFSVIDRDFKTLQYYSSPNQMVATQTSNHPKGSGKPNRYLQSYRPDFTPACCTGNVQRMFPNFVGRMWLGDGHGGLAAALFGPSSVHTKVGLNETPVTITEITDYPFGEEINFSVTTEKPVEFPFYLRIPEWAEGATVTVNGQPAADQPKPSTFFKLQRTFADNDAIKLTLPMKVRLETPVAEGQSLVRGPLVFSVKIKQEPAKAGEGLGKDPNFPAWDYQAASPWNYSLALKAPEDLNQVKVKVRPVKDYPWTSDSSPVTLTAPARLVPSWILTPKGENPVLPKAPFEVASKTDEIQLVPQGASELHVTVFPKQ